MTRSTNCYATITALLAATSTQASPCAPSIARVQAQIDAAIERQAGTDGWKSESLDALRGYQPTPRSLAATEGSHRRGFEQALDALAQARAASDAGDSAGCHRALTNARAALRP